METPVQIDKRALIARMNQIRQRAIVDTHYKIIDGFDKLILVYEDGHEEIFKGLRAA